MSSLFIAVLALIVYGSFYPWHFAAMDTPANPFWILLHSWPATFNRFAYRDIAVNVALYLPAGFTGFLAFRKVSRGILNILAPILICAFFSGTIELIQLFVPSRDCSLLDLLSDVAGATMGAFLGKLLEDIFPMQRVRGVRRRLPDRAAQVLLCCLIGTYLFPLFPSMGRTALGQKVAVFVHAPFLNPLIVASTALVWIAAGNLFHAAAFRSPRWLTIISVAIIPAQFFIVDRQPDPSVLVGAAAGAICFALFWPKRKGSVVYLRRLLAWVFLAMIVARGLAPFHFDAVNSFSWLPFGGFLNVTWQTGIQRMAEKFFIYGTSIWLLRTAGLWAGLATPIAAVTLLLIEIAQTRLPGRTPEITDPLLALFAGFALAAMARRTPPHAPNSGDTVPDPAVRIRT